MSSIPTFPGSCSSVSLKIMMDPSAPPSLKIIFFSIILVEKKRVTVRMITLIWKLRWHHGNWDEEHHGPVRRLDKCSKQGDKRLTPSPHSFSNRLSSKSCLMGWRKSHAEFSRLAGEAAIMVSTSTLKLLNYRFIPTTKGSAKTRAASDFLKAIGAVPGLETKDAMIQKNAIM